MPWKRTGFFRGCFLRRKNYKNSEKPLDISAGLCYYNHCSDAEHLTWGYSSAGRALEWHSRGQRFDPAYLHQERERPWNPVPGPFSFNRTWACSSVGRAFGSHPRGREFESLQVHQLRNSPYRCASRPAGAESSAGRGIPSLSAEIRFAGFSAELDAKDERRGTKDGRREIWRGALGIVWVLESRRFRSFFVLGVYLDWRE